MLFLWWYLIYHYVHGITKLKIDILHELLWYIFILYIDVELLYNLKCNSIVISTKSIHFIVNHTGQLEIQI